MKYRWFGHLAMYGGGVAMLLACTSSPAASALSLEGIQFATLSPAAQQLIQTARTQTKAENIAVLDVGQGQKTPAAFSVTLNFKQPEIFKTLDSSSGIPASTIASHVELLLLENNAPPPSGDVSSLVVFPLSGYARVTKNLSGSPPTQTIVFSNIPPNSTGKKYYVAARMIYENSSPFYVLNLVNPTSTPRWHGNSTNPVVVSSSGGDGNGGVFVDSNYQIPPSDTAPLQMAITLLDEKGATIDSRINVTEGSTGIPPINVTSP